MSEPTLRIDQIQAEVQEIAEVLQREQPDQTIAELWEEALSLHCVRYETKVLPPKDASPVTVTVPAGADTGSLRSEWERLTGSIRRAAKQGPDGRSGPCFGS
jgi:hypothetical protein